MRPVGGDPNSSSNSSARAGWPRSAWTSRSAGSCTDRIAALVGDFGAGDQAVLDVLFGRAPAGGRLPFELPASMADVRRQREDVPFDAENPTFPTPRG